jgi:hypothetical protein
VARGRWPGAALTGDGVGRAGVGGHRRVDGVDARTEDAGGKASGGGPAGRLWPAARLRHADGDGLEGSGGGGGSKYVKMF